MIDSMFRHIRPTDRNIMTAFAGQWFGFGVLHLVLGVLRTLGYSKDLPTIPMILSILSFSGAGYILGSIPPRGE